MHLAKPGNSILYTRRHLNTSGEKWWGEHTRIQTQSISNIIVDNRGKCSNQKGITQVQINHERNTIGGQLLLAASYALCFFPFFMGGFSFSFSFSDFSVWGSSGRVVWKNFFVEPTWLHSNFNIFLPLIHFSIIFMWVLLFNPSNPQRK